MTEKTATRKQLLTRKVQQLISSRHGGFCRAQKAVLSSPFAGNVKDGANLTSLPQESSVREETARRGEASTAEGTRTHRALHFQQPRDSKPLYKPTLLSPSTDPRCSTVPLGRDTAWWEKPRGRKALPGQAVKDAAVRGGDMCGDGRSRGQLTPVPAKGGQQDGDGASRAARRTGTGHSQHLRRAAAATRDGGAADDTEESAGTGEALAGGQCRHAGHSPTDARLPAEPHHGGTGLVV